MQLIAGAPPDQKKTIGRFANELKQAIEARWAVYQSAAAAARARRRRGRHAARPACRRSATAIR